MSNESKYGVFNRLWAIAENNAKDTWINEVRDAFLKCSDTDMGECAEIPLEQWDALKAAIMRAPSPSKEFKKLYNETLSVANDMGDSTSATAQ